MGEGEGKYRDSNEYECDREKYRIWNRNVSTYPERENAMKETLEDTIRVLVGSECNRRP